MVTLPLVSWWLEDPEFNSRLVHYLSCLCMLQLLDRIATCYTTLKSSRTSDAGHQFLLNMSESFALMGATLALIHPSLIATWEPDLVNEVMKLWPLPFNAFLVISNRQTVSHCDVQGILSNYNLLATFGSYNDGCFEVPAVGLRFVYNPGTLIGISGKILLHRVGAVFH